MKRPCNIEVSLRKGESQDKLIKRFFKKCKKSEVIKEHLEKTMFFRSEKTKRKEKQRKNEWLRQKQAEELLKSY